MKADDYAQRILIKTRDEIPAEGSLIVRDMILEIMEIAEKRKAISNAAMIAIIKEQGIKWLAIVERCRGYAQLNPAAFRIGMMKLVPESVKDIPYKIWRGLWPGSTRSLTTQALEAKIWRRYEPSRSETTTN